MWSPTTRHEEKKEESRFNAKEGGRSVRFIHMQISTPKNGNKTRACKVKEALMIIFATSKHIKLHPKEIGAGEIITNIDDLVTTEEVTNQYFFDKKIGGKKYIRGEGAVEYYVTKVRLETDISLNQMKWHTSMKFLEALKAQHIFLQEYNDGKIMRTGNVGWIAGMNPANTSIAKITTDLNKVLQQIDAIAIIDVHTVSIRFPLTKKAFVTRAYKIVSDNDKLDNIKTLLRRTMKDNDMGLGWEDKELVDFNMDKQTTAMMIEKHNKILHDTAVIAIKNIWSITEKGDAMTSEERMRLGLNDDHNEVSTIEEMWWNLANKYQHDVQGMVARRGTLEILTTRSNLNDTMGFVRELVSNTVTVLGDKKFAKLTANYNPESRQPIIQEAPMVLAGKGKVKLDTTLFTEDEFKTFAQKHGIPTGERAEETNGYTADTTRPPKAFYHKAGREPVEHDPRTMRDGARSIWEKFLTKHNKEQGETDDATRKNKEEIRKKIPPIQPPHLQLTRRPEQLSNDEIIQKGKILRLENSMKAMTNSQEAMEKSTSECHKKILSMKTNTEESISTISDMISKMGDSITAQNQKLELQAKAQLQQAEDIQKMMAAITTISNALQTTRTPTHDNNMEIDIPASNQNKRKQTSIEPTTLLTADTMESIMTQPTEAKDPTKGAHNAGEQ